MSNAEVFPMVDVEGSPYHRGVQHGRAVPERVERSIALYRKQMINRGIDERTLMELARGMELVIQKFDEEYLDEMRGIAEGARVRLEEVILINCRTEMMFGYADLKNTAAAEKMDGADGDCTGIVVLPELAAEGRLMHAHNWDWREECVDSGIVLRIRRENGPDILTFTEAGALARHGLNANGVSITGNSLSCTDDFRKAGDAPLVLVRRRLLECTNLSQAMKALLSTRRYCANNMTLAQAGGWAINMECAPENVYPLAPVNDLLVHANHWLCPVARMKLKDPRMEERTDSLYRQYRVEAALRRAGPGITWDHIKDALADDFGKPDSVLRWPKPASFDSISATVATTLMDPAEGKMWIARMPYAGRHFHEYSL